MAVNNANTTVVKSITGAKLSFFIVLVILWFIRHRLSSTIVYLGCFTSNAKNIGESMDIFEL